MAAPSPMECVDIVVKIANVVQLFKERKPGLRALQACALPNAEHVHHYMLLRLCVHSTRILVAAWHGSHVSCRSASGG